MLTNTKKGGTIEMGLSLKEAKDMANVNYEFFKEHKDELVSKYSGKFVVIKNSEVIAVYDSFDEAYNSTTKTEEIGTFLIQLCSNEDG